MSKQSMKFFIIAGEASGDLHAAHLMRAIKQQCPGAEFRYYGGEQMQAEGGTLLCHYRQLAYMGFVQVALHLRTILRGMARCKREIEAWQPDALILVDYPGFNLKMARYVKQRAICPVFYYISPKIWAWKEHRINAIRRDVDRLFSILPFEVDFFERKHHYPISYVGNPTVDEVSAYCHTHGTPVPDGRTIALLPGSRRQEITDNLSRMLCAVRPWASSHHIVVAMAPGVEPAFYHGIMHAAGIAPDSVQLVSGRHTRNSTVPCAAGGVLLHALRLVHIACAPLFPQSALHLVGQPYSRTRSSARVGGRWHECNGSPCTSHPVVGR